MTTFDDSEQALLKVPRTRARREVTHNCVYQVVWCTKFARPLLAEVLDEASALLRAAAVEAGAELFELVVTDAVVKFQAKVDPTQGVHRLVTHMKATSSAALRSRHPRLKSRAPSLWNSKYLVASVGEGAARDTLREFLEQQRRV